MTEIILNKLLETSIALSSEMDGDVLLETILTAAMDITCCDAGTLYIKNEENLDFKIMITKSQNIYSGGKFSEISIPPVPISPTNVCAKALIDRKTINIPDLSENTDFDFVGPKKYDALTGYKTKSMLVVPMENKNGEQIGVLQLMNALSESGEIVAFDETFEKYVLALASQAAISIVNINHKEEMRIQLESLVGALSAASYIRTPYNVTHTQNMVRYGNNFINWINKSDHDWNFTLEQKREFLMSIWLHDVGKLTVPLEIMNKETRLSTALERVLTRLEIISLSAKLEETKGGTPYNIAKEKIDFAKDIILQANSIGFLNDELEGKIIEISNYTYLDDNGQEQKWLTEDEVDKLTIKRGTLTQGERKVMESHVEMTKEILQNVKFGVGYENVPIWASQHHEFVNGKGYPLKIANQELDKEARLLTIIDVFDGLSAKDRPYKPAIPLDKVIKILLEMEKEGKLDKEILNLFLESKSWE